MPSYLNKQQILDAQDRKFEDVEVPEWGGTVRIGTMTAAQRDRYEVMFTKLRGDKDPSELTISLRAVLVAACIVDENGDQLFTLDDVDALGKKSGSALTRVFNKALEMNILTKEAAEKVAGS